MKSILFLIHTFPISYFFMVLLYIIILSIYLLKYYIIYINTHYHIYIIATDGHKSVFVDDVVVSSFKKIFF